MPMPDYLVHLYNALPWFIQWPIWFLIQIILVRGLLANKILSEIRQSGLYEHRIIQAMRKRVGAWTVIGRKSAIIRHYRLQAQGAGHDSDNVLDCGQGRCAIF